MILLGCLYVVQNKCTKYWPELEESKPYGKVHVCMLQETTNPHYLLREFVISHEDEDTDPRTVTQFHFKAWPDHGVPHDPGAVLGFLQSVTLKHDQYGDEADSGPIVVHCSAGIGRTGTFIVVDILLSLIDHQGSEVRGREGGGATVQI